MLLFFDTETTGLDRSSHLVQLAAILTEDDGTLRGSCNLTVKPDGYEIPKEASDIHGINTEIATKSGVPLSVAISVFNNFAIQCAGGKLIAHNIKYDVGIIGSAYSRGGWPSRLGDMQHFCTMEALTPICKLPGKGYGYKWPRLSEAYEFAFKKPLLNAHDALYDVMACKDLYFWVVGQFES